VIGHQIVGTATPDIVDHPPSRTRLAPNACSHCSRGVVIESVLYEPVAGRFDSQRGFGPGNGSGKNADEELRRGVVVGLAVYLMWGLLTLYWKLLREFDPIELIGWRVISSSVVMALIVTATRRWAHLRVLLADRALLLRVAGAALLLTVNWTSYVWAVVHDQVIQTALGYFMAPLGTILIGVVVFKEHLRVAQRVAVALALAALIVLTVSYGKVPWLALAIAVSWSLYGWMKKSVPLSPLESMAAESLLLLVPASLAVVVLSSNAGSVASSASGGEMVLVALTGVATAVPLMMFAWSAQRVPLTLLGPMQYSVPTINFLLGWLLYGESMPPSRLTGFALVWVGLLLVTADAVRRSRSASTFVVDDPLPV
jgi:chloramphenicol-sensitive protein RarD